MLLYYSSYEQVHEAWSKQVYVIVISIQNIKWIFVVMKFQVTRETRVGTSLKICKDWSPQIVNHREFFFFFRYYLSSVVCVCVCMYVFSITATPFNPELSNFGITFLMWISKNSFISNFWNIVFFLQSYRPFSIFL